MSKPLKRLDVIIRGNSSISELDAIKWTKDWVNKRQSDTDKFEFYADLFDSRTNKMFKVFSDLATNSKNIQNTYSSGSVKIKGVITVFGDEPNRTSKVSVV